jgi:ribonucleoside-diphosphate reductase beta chain
LDSVQGRAPAESFGSIVSLPELENWIITWTFSETIHSRSYTHIIRNIYSNPSKIFDEMMDVQEILDCADSISGYYDNLIEMAGYYNLLGEGTHTVNGKKVVVDRYEMKKLLFLTLMSVNILEGVRFYVSFACSWAFAELKKMEGNAKIIKLIARDENLHLASTQMLIKLLKQEDPDFEKIAQETEEECVQMFIDAVDQEKAWAEYLFKDGSMIGLNTELLSQYIEFIATRRMTNVKLKSPYGKTSNPLPWTQKWISGAEVQVAPQETEITSYVQGGTKQDVSTDTFKGFSL